MKQRNYRAKINDQLPGKGCLWGLVHYQDHTHKQHVHVAPPVTAVGAWRRQKRWCGSKWANTSAPTHWHRPLATARGPLLLPNIYRPIILSSLGRKAAASAWIFISTHYFNNEGEGKCQLNKPLIGSKKEIEGTDATKSHNQVNCYATVPTSKNNG